MPHESLAVFWHNVDYQQCMDAKKNDPDVVSVCTAGPAE